MITKVYLAWWWPIYARLTVFGLWLGVPIDEDRVVADMQRAVRTKAVSDD